MEKCIRSRCVQSLLKIVRWFPVVFISVIISWGYYGYVVEFSAKIVEQSFLKALYIVIFHILFIMFIWSYLQTVISKIAVPPNAFYLSCEIRETLEKAQDEHQFREVLENFTKSRNIPVSNRSFEGGVRFCPSCACIKPDRSHHCSICGRCILKFDHHCPWVNTCVNFNNYKYFILFLGYGFLLCAFACITILPFFVLFWQRSRFAETTFGMLNTLFLFFVSGMFSLSLGGLFFYHIYLTAKNKSTIETFRPPVFSYGIDKNGYNLGVKRNFEQVFGTKFLYWGIPLFTSLGDGVEYILRLSPEIGQRNNEPNYVTYHNVQERTYRNHPVNEQNATFNTSMEYRIYN